MMDVFNYENIENFLKDYYSHVKATQSHGALKKLSESLGITQVQLNHIFTGKRLISKDEAFLLSQNLKLAFEQEQYLLNLVELSRANQKSYKDHLKENLKKIRETNKEHGLSGLTEAQKSKFCSSWIYPAVLLLTGTKEFQSSDLIAIRLGQPKVFVIEVLEFLLSVAMIKGRDPHFEINEEFVHVPHTSKLANMNHANWRKRAIEKTHDRDSDDIFQTMPMNLSHQLAGKFRKHIESFLIEFKDDIIACEPDDIYCLNMDFFRV